MTLSALSAMASGLFMASKAPLIIALLIAAQTTLVALSIYALLATSWLAFILFIVFVRAIIIIFAYVSSLASNDFMATPYALVGSAVGLLLILALTVQSTLTRQEADIKSQSGLSDIDLGPLAYYKLYSSSTRLLTMLLITYLLVALIVVAKISMISKGALRSRGH